MKIIPKFILVAIIGLMTGFFGIQVFADGNTDELKTTREAVAAAVAAETTYSPASFSAFEQILTDLGGFAAVDAMIAAPTSQPDVDAMVTSLQGGLAKLVTQSSLDSLTEKNNLARVAYYENRNDYTRTSHDAFKEAVDAYGDYLAVNEMIADTDITQTEIGAAATAIDAAMTLLVEQGDTTDLEAAYEAALEEDLTPFIPVSVTAYSAELARIYGILTGNDATQARLDETTEAVEAAKTLLIPFADKTGLSETILKAEALKAEKYTPSSYFVLNILLTEAETMNGNPDAIQGEVDQMVVDLLARIEALVRMPDEIELIVGTEELDISTYVRTGNSTIAGYVSSDPSVATVDASGIVTPIQFGSATITVTLANGVIDEFPIFIKEKIRLTTILMVSGLPLLSVAIGSVLILAKTRPVKIVQRVQGKQEKVKKPKKTITLPSDELTKTNKEL